MPAGNADYLWKAFQEQLPALDNDAVIENHPEGIDWNTVINIGKKVWEVIEKNQPVLDVQKSSASAVPVCTNSIAQFTQLTYVIRMELRIGSKWLVGVIPSPKPTASSMRTFTLYAAPIMTL